MTRNIPQRGNSSGRSRKFRGYLGRNFLPVLLFSTVFFSRAAYGQTGDSNSANAGILPGRHRGAVTCLLRDGNGRILSAGEDGFLEIWNTRSAEERFQLSPYSIVSMVLRPGKSQITVVENDGLSLYRISAWDYETGKNLFTLRFRDSITYINYSAQGSFLIVARSGRTGVALIHSETGEVLESPGELTGNISFAATGRSERTMICYASSGSLSYWDLESGNETQRFEVPSDISSPVLFGNNRFLGGFDRLGLLVLDAVSGSILARDEYIRQGTIFTDNSPSPSGSPGAVRFNCLSSSGRTSTIFRMEISSSGRLSTASRTNVPSEAADPGSVLSAGNETTILGTKDGNLWLLTRNSARVMDTGKTERIIDAAASPSAIAFIHERGELGHIPLDFSLLGNDSVLQLERLSGQAGSAPYNSITGEPSFYGRYTPVQNEAQSAAQFLLWQSGAGRTIPVLKTVSGILSGAYASQFSLEKLPMRFPVRSAAIMGNSVLFLDTAGTVSILNRETGDIRFSYSAAGAVDAAFIDQNTIIISRSSVTGNTPFLIVNTSTGETVSLAYPAMVGIRVYRGLSGAIYGAMVNQSSLAMQTSIIRLNTANPSQSEKLVDYNGEDASFSIAESGGNLASTLGGSGATLYLDNRSRTPEIIPMERSAGLPVKILDGGGRWFIILDGEGSISWHDNRTGKILAVFTLYSNFWIMHRKGETIRGQIR